MYQFRYEIVKKRGPLTKTLLYAQFKFGDEVASKDKDKIRERIEKDFPWTRNSLTQYLMQVEGFRKTGYNLGLECEDGRTLKIKPCLIQLGFDIKVIVLSEKSLEEMLNLNRLNEFIFSNVD